MIFVETEELLALEVQSRKRVHVLCGLDDFTDEGIICELDTYGLGTQRTRQDFEVFAKVNFKKQKVNDVWGGLESERFEEPQKQKKLDDVLALLAKFKT